MSGSRGRKGSSHHPENPRFNNPRWPSHPQQYYTESSSVNRSWSNEGWNWSPGYNMWQNSHSNIQLWPQPQYRHNDQQRGGGDSFHYEQFHHERFSNSYNHPGGHFSERSLAHLHQTPLNELAGGSHSTARDSFSQQGSSSFGRQLSSVSRNIRQISVINQSKSADRETVGDKTRDSRNPSSQAGKSTTTSAPKVVGEKQTSDSFMPPNNDLRNIVKASLKMIGATKDPTVSDKTVQNEAATPSSPQRTRESRISATDTTTPTSASPSTSNNTRLAVRSVINRRVSQSSTSSNPASTTSASDNNPLGGIGFIQRTSSETTLNIDQSARIRRASTNSNSEGAAKDGETLTSISREQLNQYILSMDNHQRRQLVEQPRANASQYMLNHLVQENQTARARQLSSLRFRVNSSELEVTSRTETHVSLPEDLVEQIKELLANEDNEAAQTTKVTTDNKPAESEEDEEIQVLEPPPKEPPLCIDLDLDDQPSPPPAPNQDNHAQNSGMKPIERQKTTPAASRAEALIREDQARKAAKKQRKALKLQEKNLLKQQEKSALQKALDKEERQRLKKLEKRKKKKEKSQSSPVVGNSVDASIEATIAVTSTQVVGHPTIHTSAAVVPTVSTTMSSLNVRPAISTAKTPAIRPPSQTVQPIMTPTKTPQVRPSVTPTVRSVVSLPSTSQHPSQTARSVVNSPLIRPATFTPPVSTVRPAVPIAKRPVAPAVVRPLVSSIVRPIAPVVVRPSVIVPSVVSAVTSTVAPPVVYSIVLPVVSTIASSTSLSITTSIASSIATSAASRIVPAVTSIVVPPVVHSTVLPVASSTSSATVSSQVETVGPSVVPSIVPSSVPSALVVPTAVSSNESATTPPVLPVPPAVPRIETPEIAPIVSQVPPEIPAEVAVTKPAKHPIESLVQTTPVQPLIPTGRNRRSISSFSLLLVEFQLEEQQGKERIAQIDQTIEALQLERKALTEKVLTLKQRQFDLLRSTLTNKPFESEANSPKSEEESPQVETEPIKEENAMELQIAVSGEVPPNQSPTAVASNQLLSLMQQLEENGVQVAIGELEKSPNSDSQNSSAINCGKKRKWTDDEEVKSHKKTTNTFQTSSEVAVDSSKNIQPTPSPPLPVDPPSSPLPNNSPMSSPTLVVTLPGASSDSSPSTIQIVESFSIPVLESSRWRGKSKTKRNLDDEPGKSSDDSQDQQPPPLLPLLKDDMKTDSLAEKSSDDPKKLLDSTELPVDSDSTKTDSPPPVLEQSKLNTEKSLTQNEKLFVLERHESPVRCIFVNGPCIFSSSQDGTVHVYDMITGHLSMRILGHQQPVTWLFAVSLNVPSSGLRNIATAAEYLNQLNLITGSEDACIRQFSLETGGLLHEVDCKCAVTCVSANKSLGKLYVGSKEGTIFTYNPKNKVLQTSNFKVKAEVVCLRVLRCREKRAIVVVPKRMDPVIFDLETGNILLTLPLTCQGTLINCVTTFSNFVFCCDNRKRVYTFDMNNAKPLYQIDVLPTAAVSSFHDGKHFLILGCCDGIIRALDMSRKPPNRPFVLPGPHMKSLTCMKVTSDKIVGGSTKGEVTYRSIPDLEALAAKI